MKTFKVFIRPESSFRSSLIGDSLFGALVWKLLEIGKLKPEEIQKLPKKDFEKSFLVSSAFPVENNFFWTLLPKSVLFQPTRNQEENTQKLEDCRESQRFFKTRWLKLDLSKNPLEVKEKNFSHQVFSRKLNDERPGVRLDRRTGKPIEHGGLYALEAFIYNTERLVCFLRASDNFKNDILKAFENLGKTGFGRGVSYGFGKFKIDNVEEIPKTAEKHQYLLAPSPFVPDENKDQKLLDTLVFGSPRTKFGRHGSLHTYTQRPFKVPVLFCDHGAVFKTSEEYSEVGKFLTNLSSVQNAIHQAKSLLLKVTLR